MSTETRGSWFRGHEPWYLRAIVWFVQSAIAGTILLFVTGTDGLLGAVGTLATGLAGALLLFKQVDGHVNQELDRRS